MDHEECKQRESNYEEHGSNCGKENERPMCYESARHYSQRVESVARNAGRDARSAKFANSADSGRNFDNGQSFEQKLQENLLSIRELAK